MHTHTHMHMHTHTHTHMHTHVHTYMHAHTHTHAHIRTAQAPSISRLYQDMSACEKVLDSMQDILQGFQVNLGGISQEIKHLQDESSSMNVKLKNRRQGR